MPDRCTRLGSRRTMSLATSSTRWTADTTTTLPSVTSTRRRTTMRSSVIWSQPERQHMRQHHISAREAAPYICQGGSSRRLPGRQHQRTTHCRESIATLQLLRLNPTLGYIVGYEMETYRNMKELNLQPKMCERPNLHRKFP